MATDYKQMADAFANNPQYIPRIEDDGVGGSGKQSSKAVKPTSNQRQDESIEYQRPVKQYQAVSMGRQTSSKVRPSAIFSGQSIDAKRPIFERVIGLSLLALSFACTVMTFNGAWGVPSIKALSIGIGLQFLATMAQWFWRNERLSVWYMIAIAFDAGMSVKGFSIPLLAPFKRLAASISTEQVAPFAAWGLIVILSIALAVLPEVILIDKD